MQPRSSNLRVAYPWGHTLVAVFFYMVWDNLPHNNPILLD